MNDGSFWTGARETAVVVVVVWLVYAVGWSLFEFWIPLLKGHFVLE